MDALHGAAPAPTVPPQEPGLLDFLIQGGPRGNLFGELVKFGRSERAPQGTGAAGFFGNTAKNIASLPEQAAIAPIQRITKAFKQGIRPGDQPAIEALQQSTGGPQNVDVEPGIGAALAAIGGESLSGMEMIGNELVNSLARGTRMLGMAPEGSTVGELAKEADKQLFESGGIGPVLAALAIAGAPEGVERTARTVEGVAKAPVKVKSAAGRAIGEVKAKRAAKAAKEARLEAETQKLIDEKPPTSAGNISERKQQDIAEPKRLVETKNVTRLTPEFTERRGAETPVSKPPKRSSIFGGETENEIPAAATRVPEVAKKLSGESTELRGTERLKQAAESLQKREEIETHRGLMETANKKAAEKGVGALTEKERANLRRGPEELAKDINRVSERMIGTLDKPKERVAMESAKPFARKQFPDLVRMADKLGASFDGIVESNKLKREPTPFDLPDEVTTAVNKTGGDVGKIEIASDNKSVQALKAKYGDPVKAEGFPEGWKVFQDKSGKPAGLLPNATFRGQLKERAFQFTTKAGDTFRLSPQETTLANLSKQARDLDIKNERIHTPTERAFIEKSKQGAALPEGVGRDVIATRKTSGGSEGAIISGMEEVHIRQTAKGRITKESKFKIADYDAASQKAAKAGLDVFEAQKKFIEDNTPLGNRDQIEARVKAVNDARKMAMRDSAVEDLRLKQEEEFKQGLVEERARVEEQISDEIRTARKDAKLAVDEATAEIDATNENPDFGFGAKTGNTIGGALDDAMMRGGIIVPPGFEGHRQLSLGDGMLGVQNIKEPGVFQYVTTPTNYTGAIPGMVERLGHEAALAVRKSALAENHINVDLATRRHQIETTVKDIDPKDFGKRGEVFIDAFEGRSVQEILANPSISAKTKRAAVKLRVLLERDRVYLRDHFRDNSRAWVTKDMEQKFRKEHGLEGKKLNEEQNQAIAKMANKELERMIPDEWGIDNYFPHVFPGQHKIKLKGNTVGSAVTPFEAVNKMKEMMADDPSIKPSDFKLESKGFLDPDMVRTGKGRFFRVVKDLTDAMKASRDDVEDGLRGNIGMMMNRKKFFGSILKRQGAVGFSDDMMKAMDMYNQGMARYKTLTQLNREVQPLLEKMRSEGRGALADYTEKVFNQTWGNRDRGFSGAFDATIQNIPGVRNVVAPFALDRWLQTLIKTPTANLKWRYSIRGQALNSFQNFQTTLAVTTPSEFSAGLAWSRTAEAVKARRRHGVQFFGGKQLEGRSRTGLGVRGKVAKAADVVEQFNQDTAWSIMYHKANKIMGFDDRAAAEYAFLRGNVQTQFVPLRTDVPPALRGPFPSTIGMFKRFGIKDTELGFNLLRQRQMKGVAKWATAKFLLGGSRIITRPATIFGTGWLTLQAYRKLKDEVGEDAADFAFYGLPGLIDLDVSYSIQMADVPRGESFSEALGNTMLGPAGSDAVKMIKAWKDTKGPERDKFERSVKELVRSNPSLRWIEGINQLQRGAENGLYDFRSPDGTLKYKNDLRGVIINMLGGKVVGDKIVGPEGKVIDLGPYEVWADAVARVQAKQSEAMDEIAQLAADGKDYTGPWLKWNEMWPEHPIDPDAVRRRAQERLKSRELTDRQRKIKSVPKGLKPEFAPEVTGQPRP